MLYSECADLGYTKYDGDVVQQFLNQVSASTSDAVYGIPPISENTVLCCAVMNYTVLYCTALYRTAQC